MRYSPLYWFSRYPSKISPTWNLLRLFDPQTWILTFVSILSVTFCFSISARIGSSYFGIRTYTVEIALSPFRVPLLRNQHPFGFSSRILFLLWCVCGGFLLHFLECNFLSILVKPNYEKPIDTAQDILDRGFNLIAPPRYAASVMNQKNSPSNMTRKLAEKYIIPEV